MLQKIALFVASLAAALTLAVALAAAGFAPGATTPPVASTTPASTVGADVAEVAAPPPVQVDKVYIAPPKPQKTITVHKVVKAGGGEESEGSEGDD